MNDPTFYQDQGLRRTAEVTAADWDGGMNRGGSNAPVLGVATDVPNLTGDPSGHTLLDQNGAARSPQTSQHIGQAGSNLNFTDNAADHNNTVRLVTLATGWENVAVV